MKKYFMTLWAVVVAFAACTTPAEEPQDKAEEVILAEESISFDAVDAEPKDVVVTLENCVEWNVSSLDSDWLTIEKTIVDGQLAIRVSVEDNTAEESRETTIYVSGNTAIAELTVTQLGLAPTLSVDPKEVKFVAAGGQSTVAVTANVEWKITFEAEWLTVTESEEGLTIVAAENTEPTEREAVVKIGTDYTVGTTIKVLQEAAEVVIPDRVRDNQAFFVPYSEVIYEDDSRSGYGVENMFDNNLETYWSCPNAGINENAVLTFKFDRGYRIDYMDYYPSPEYGQWGKFSVRYKADDAKEYVEVGDFDFGMKDGKQTIRFEESLMNVVELVIEVKTAKGRSVTQGLLAGAAEVEFFYSNDVYYTAIELFEDESCSVFRDPKFSSKDLSKVKDDMLRDIAEIMLIRTPEDNEFRVATYKSYPNPMIDANRYLNAPYSKYDNVTGMLLLPGSTNIICVSDDGRDDITVKLTVIHYKSPKIVSGKVHETENDWAIRDYVLRPGINTITLPNDTSFDNYGGLCYIQLMSSDDLSVKVNFIDGEVNGYYDTEVHSPDRFEEFLNNSFAIEEEYGFPAHLDVRNSRIVMSFPSYLYKQKTQTGERAKEVIDLYAQIIELEEELQGHKLFNTGGHANRMHMVGRYGGSFMYATSYHTGYNILRAPDCVNPDGLREGCWGPAHEFGHVNQVRPILKWVGTTEVTNNICSAYVQWKLNDYTVLGKQNSTHGFNAAFKNIMARGCSHVLVGSWDAAYYMKVVPFWQLYLYFTEVKGMTDFYPTIYHTSRNYPDAATVSNEEAMLRFCELVSDVTKTDMTEFFELWGFLTPVDVWFDDYGSQHIIISQERIDKARKHMAQYPKPTQPIHFISERNMHLFKEPAEVTVGTVSHAAGQVLYHFRNWENCVAFIVVGNDGRMYGISDTASAFVSTSWNEYQWGDSNGKVNPEGGHINSKTYYRTVNTALKEFTEANLPALKGAKCYGVDANGKLYEAQ